MLYRTKENDMLDWICWKHYGFQSGAVEFVLKYNPDLAEYGSKLPGGLVIKLPAIKKKSIEKVRLWE